MKLVLVFLLFLKFGFLCIGGGYMLVPLYVDEFVEKRQWISHEEFGDLMAITQITPGPIGINGATFLGYRAAGVPGAIVASAALLMPSFFLMMLALHYLSKWKNSRAVEGIMWGAAPATMALIISALAIFAEMSVLSGPVPWSSLLSCVGGDAGAVAAFPAVRPFAVLICGACVYGILRMKMRVTTLIFLSAAAGAIVFPLLGA